MKIEESYIARRRFLCGMIGGGATVLGAGALVPLGYYAANIHPEPLPDFLVLVEEEHRLAPGTSRMLLYGRIPVLLIQTPGPDSELKVFDAICTHLDCTVGYQDGAEEITCACHNGHYSLDGRVVSGPPPRPLRQLFQKRKGDKLAIALEEENLDKAFEEPPS